ncbi:MAG: V-type ATPase subunit, partial [Oscillospiraceae bacterium]|nr:V-type ATPase subunit [Oscillospiraceae bacterium]
MRKSPASANVISAKARAMYGQCLKPQQFQELLACHSVGEVAAYLKNRTRYSGVLADISESSIHRGHLETLLRRKLYDDVAALGRYDEKVNMHATTYLVERQEVSLIMQCLRLLSAGMMDRFLFTMPLFFTEHASFDMLAMEKVRTPAALLDLLGHTPYYKILEPFLQDA